MTLQIQSLTARRWRHVGAACLLSLGLCAASAPQALAQQEPRPAIVADAVVPVVKVTLEARRLPLSQVLAEVNKQTGVDLAVAEGTFAREPKMTMAVSEMPLREWMESLATLYDVSWQAAGPNAFQLQPSGRSEDEKGVRQLGSWYNFWAWPFQDGRRPEYLPARGVPDWKALVDDNLDLQAINTTGVPLADAPAELQKAVRAEVEHEVASELVFDARLLFAARGPLRILVAKPPGGSGYTVNVGQRNEKSVMTPHPVNAQVTNKEDETVGRFDFRPPSRGRELLNDWTLFPPTDPVLAQAAPPAQAGK